MPTYGGVPLCGELINNSSFTSWMCQSRSEFGFYGIDVNFPINSSYSFTYSAKLIPSIRSDITIPILNDPYNISNTFSAIEFFVR